MRGLEIVKLVFSTKLTASHHMRGLEKAQAVTMATG